MVISMAVIRFFFTETPQGLKPYRFETLYAALKRRSSTVMPAFWIFLATVTPAFWTFHAAF